MSVSTLADSYFTTFAEIGRDLFLMGAIVGREGNISMRMGDRILITRSGCRLGRLVPGDVIETGLEPSGTDAMCSRELVVHRAIYHACDALAVVHGHPAHTTFRSFLGESIEPLDSESKFALGERVPVLAPAQVIASPEAAEMVARVFQAGGKVAVLRSHGPFAAGADLGEAAHYVGCLEVSCRILDLRDATGATL